jgi:hypothetical protein
MKFLAVFVSMLVWIAQIVAGAPAALDEAQMAEKLASLAIASRYDGPYEQLNEQVSSTVAEWRASGRKPTPDEQAKYDALLARVDKEGKLEGQASEARLALGNQLGGLVLRHDPAVIRLMGPLLGEQTKTFDAGDSIDPGPQERAAGALGARW